MSPEPFHYVFQPSLSASPRLLLLLHGTGGNEHDLLPLGHHLDSEAALLSPRGKVREGDAHRYFRRFSEGVLDIADWHVRTHELADFLTIQTTRHGFKTRDITAVGFSNGANIALGLLLLHPELLGRAILFRPMFVTDDLPPMNLEGKSVLILSGEHDPLIRHRDADKVSHQLSSRGMDVRLQIIPAGHGLTQTDIAIATTWLKQGYAGTG